jgi:hypothetical protein
MSWLAEMTFSRPEVSCLPRSTAKAGKQPPAESDNHLQPVYRKIL